MKTTIAALFALLVAPAPLPKKGPAHDGAKQQTSKKKSGNKSGNKKLRKKKVGKVVVSSDGRTPTKVAPISVPGGAKPVSVDELDLPPMIGVPKLDFSLVGPSTNSLQVIADGGTYFSTVSGHEGLGMPGGGKGRLALLLRRDWIAGKDLDVSCSGNFSGPINVTVSAGAEDLGRQTFDRKGFRTLLTTSDLNHDYSWLVVALERPEQESRWFHVMGCSVQRLD